MQLLRRTSGKLTTTAIGRALAAKGLTDAQARAAVSGASSFLEGLIAVGLLPAPAPTPSPTPTPTPVPTPTPSGPLTFAVAPYDFTGKDRFLAADPKYNVFENTFNSARHLSDDYLDARAEISLFGPSAVNIFLSRWSTGTAAVGNSSYLFGVDGATGFLQLASFAASGRGGAFNSAKSTATLLSVLPARTRAQVRVVANYGTVALNGFAPGTTTFFILAADGVTWTQIGNVVASPTNGFSSGGTTGFTAGTINQANNMHGRLYRCSVRKGDGTVLYNPDFRAMTIAQKGTFADNAPTPATFTINGPISCSMAPRTTSYPRISTAQTWKAKICEISPDVAFSNANGDWGKLWANYPNAQFAERIQWAKDRGANAVKWTCSGSTVSYNYYPSPALLEGYIADVCGVLRAKDMKLYLSLAHSDEVAAPDGSGIVARVASIVSTAALWMKYGQDLIIGADMCNEIQFGFAPPSAGLAQSGKPTTWGAHNSTTPTTGLAQDLTYLYQQLRTVMPDVPLTASVYMAQRTDLTNSELLRLQATLGFQFHDYHPYNGQNGKTTADSVNTAQFPVSADCANLEANNWFEGRHLVGEVGIQRRHSATNKTNFINGIYAQGSRAASAGYVHFIDYDFTSGSEPGDYGIRDDATLTSLFAAGPNGTPIPATV